MSAYKDTLNLPKTAFPMKAGLTGMEPRMLDRWEQEDLYGQIQKARAGCPEYILHDGPPFANGDVHMGTALNKILKDMVVKSKSMLGFRAPYLPGWDCHGLPIEFKVVRESSGLSPVEVRRRSEEYARKFIEIQKRQFRRLGVLGEWDHPYLTLDPSYEAEILRVFGKFVAKGLVYRSKKPVFWSTGAQTALAEAEVEYQDKTSPSVYVAFSLQGEEETDVVIWTTTPWTLPANLAIAVHPNHTYVRARLAGGRTVVVAEDLLPSLTTKLSTTAEITSRFPGRELEGLQARHPFLDRLATLYTADFVTLETGTGCVHVAPGHGEDDYLLGLKHGLELLAPVDDQGLFTGECGVPALVGKQVFEANEAVIAILRERGALLVREDYAHSYPHCWRSKTPVIFRAVEQFFIRVDALRDEALTAIDGAEWIPHWGRNRIRGTVESRPDWCISRQRSWGVPLPVFYRRDGEPVLDPKVIAKVADLIEEHGTNAWFEWDDAEWCRLTELPEGTTRRNDTLDVWIDSGVSHEAVLGKTPGLRSPADLYLEATDQHRGWFQSSLLTSVALHGSAPYRQVLTHGFVVDVDTRQKISKSQQGGYSKPTEAEHFVDKYGADLVRLWVSSVNYTDDVPFSEEIFTRLSDAYRRVRNTLRILLGNLDGFDPSRDRVPFESMPVTDQWILCRLQELIKTCRKAYEDLEFHRVYQAVTQFCAVELSSLYVDNTKDRLYCDPVDSPRRKATQSAMEEIFLTLNRLLAPILAFTTEEAWQAYGAPKSIHLELLPEVDAERLSHPSLAVGSRWLELRSHIGVAVEQAVKDGTVQKPLEARVVLQGRWNLPENTDLAALEEFLVLSHLEFDPEASVDEPKVQVTRTDRPRCERCWRHRADVGADSNHPSLCGRCSEAVQSRS